MARLGSIKLWSGNASGCGSAASGVSTASNFRAKKTPKKTKQQHRKQKLFNTFTPNIKYSLFSSVQDRTNVNPQ